MEQISVSNKAAARIKQLRDNKVGTFEGELEGILDVVYGLNNMLCYAKDDENVAQFANEIHQGIDKVLSYYEFLKLMVYDCDFKEDGQVQVTQMEE